MPENSESSERADDAVLQLVNGGGVLVRSAVEPGPSAGPQPRRRRRPPQPPALPA